MSKTGQFIQDCTKRCSDGVRPFEEWLTPDQAMRAVEITREELIDKACEWLKNWAYFSVHDTTDSFDEDDLVRRFRKAMEKE